MNTHTEKTQGNKRQSVANAVAKKSNGSKSAFQFVDNRPAAVAQRKLQAIINNGSAAKEAIQLKSMAENHSDQQDRNQTRYTSDHHLNSAGNTSTPIYQLQKDIGWYRMSKAGNLRQDNGTHSVQNSLPAGALVEVIDKGTRVSKFKAGRRNNEHSWSRIPQLNRTGWVEDRKLKNNRKRGKTPDDEHQAARTEYHFGLNGPIPGAHDFGPRMDHILATGEGTIAEYDWRDFGIDLPPHVNAADHDRLPGTMATGEDTDYNAVRAAAIAHKQSVEGRTAPPPLPVFENKSAKYTWYRKAKSSKKASEDIKLNSEDFDAGTDFSKSALVDMLVQGKKVHLHLTAMRAIWPGGGDGIMTGANFKEVLDKEGTYGNRKQDVTMRELRFIKRYWNRKLTIADDGGVERQYRFKGNALFYYDGHFVPPPWTWGAGQTGADFT